MAIQGTKKKELTRENIFKLITEYDVYRAFFGNFTINKVTKNHLRGEHVSSFLIKSKYNRLFHIDFSDSYWRGGCIDLVQQIYSCSYMEALNIIDVHFCLGFTTDVVKDYKKTITSYPQPELEDKKYATIQCVTRKFTNEELAYWNMFYQDVEDLKREHVYSIKTIYLNKERFSFKETDLRFGYLYEDKWKIYFPYQEPKRKWLPNNVPIDHLEGKENIINCDVALISKSKKDKMVLKKVFSCVCATQSENVACFSEENVKFLKENSKKQILSMDSDKAGVKNSQMITKLFDFEYVNTPRSYLSDGINDWAQLACDYGIETVEKILKRKKIIV